MLREQREEIGVALGRIPSGCSILTVTHDRRSTGLLVSWVQQASFEPPSVTVCIKRGRPAQQLMDAVSRFLLNIIGEDPASLFKHFGRGFALGDDAFAGLVIESTDFGPQIASCIAHLGCRISQKIPVGDHDLYVAEVRAAHFDKDLKPYTHLRGSGLSY